MQFIHLVVCRGFSEIYIHRHRREVEGSWWGIPREVTCIDLRFPMTLIRNGSRDQIESICGLTFILRISPNNMIHSHLCLLLLDRSVWTYLWLATDRHRPLLITDLQLLSTVVRTFKTTRKTRSKTTETDFIHEKTFFPRRSHISQRQTH